MSLRNLTRTYRHGLFYFQFDNSYMVLPTKNILTDAYEKDMEVLVKYSKKDEPSKAKLMELSDDYSYLHNKHMDIAFDQDDDEYFQLDKEYCGDDSIKKILNMKAKKETKKRKKATSTVTIKVKKAKTAKTTKEVTAKTTKTTKEEAPDNGTKAVIKKNLAAMINVGEVPAANMQINPAINTQPGIVYEQIESDISEDEYEEPDSAESKYTQTDMVMEVEDEHIWRNKLEQSQALLQELVENNTAILERLVGKIDLLNRQKLAYTSPAKPFSTIKKTIPTKSSAACGSSRVELFPEAKEISPMDLSYTTVRALRNQSVSTSNFALKLAEKLFTEEERRTSNCAGSKGKKKLDEEKMNKIYEYIFEDQTSLDEYSKVDVWKRARDAINEAGRRRPKVKKTYNVQSK